MMCGTALSHQLSREDPDCAHGQWLLCSPFPDPDPDSGLAFEPDPEPHVKPSLSPILTTSLTQQWPVSSVTGLSGPALNDKELRRQQKRLQNLLARGLTPSAAATAGLPVPTFPLRCLSNQLMCLQMCARLRGCVASLARCPQLLELTAPVTWLLQVIPEQQSPTGVYLQIASPLSP